MTSIMPLIKVTALFEALKALLVASNTLGAVLGGPNRVYRVEENFEEPEAEGDVPWGRVVIVPTQNLWGDNPQLTVTRTISFLIRAELNSYVSSGYDPSYILEGVHSTCYDVLEQQRPVMQQAAVVVPIYLNIPPQASPLWDDQRQLWFTSAEYRCEVAFKVP